MRCADLLGALARADALPPSLPRGCADRRGRSALSLAAGGGAAPAALEALRAAGYATDGADRDGLTPLSYAAQHGRTAAANWLLDHGADAAHADVFGVAPVHKAAAFGRATILADMLRRDASLAAAPVAGTERADPTFEAVSHAEHPLHLVCRSGWSTTAAQRVVSARVLLGAGAPLDAVDARGDTPLHACAACAEVDLCRLLLAAGANRRSRDGNGRPPSDRVPSAAPLVRAELTLRGC
ncbi:ankyrin repeat-containing domain protein [Pelagophyceae sp. CCMP2097]|nr:ankyrin repeat-containing domain protein [Pelagophyceae sp. CCMP2097]